MMKIYYDGNENLIYDLIKEDQRFDFTEKFEEADLVLLSGYENAKRIFLPNQIKREFGLDKNCDIQGEADGIKAQTTPKKIFASDIILTPIISKIVNMVDQNKTGKVQVVDCNLNFDEKEVLNEISECLYLFSVFTNKGICKQSVEFERSGYVHGFITNELDGGEIVRCSFTCFSEIQRESYRIYGTDLEIRLNLLDETATSLIQEPDYVGDKVESDFDGKKFFLDQLEKVCKGENSIIFYNVK